MKKYKIAFVKFGGLSAGGTERWLQMMAANVSRSKFEIDYYYCDAAPYIGSDYKHADTDAYRKKYMEEHGVNLVKFHVGAKDITKPRHPWVDTNFWEVFDGSKYDLVQTAKAGHSEYPYVEMKNKVVEYVALSGMVDHSPNIVKTIHISHWSKDAWVKVGGNPAHAEVIYIPVEEPCTQDTFRDEMNIPDDAIVCGFHQRNNDNIASNIQLAAIHRLSAPKVHTVVLGGGEPYRRQARQLGMRNIHFLPHTGNQYIISKFLNTLDIYSHGRSDGETFGTVLAEAMIHGKPCISHYVKQGANAMPETIGPAGYVVGAQDDRSLLYGLLSRVNNRTMIIREYSGVLELLVSDKDRREELGRVGRNYAMNNYSIRKCVNRLEEIWMKFLEPVHRSVPGDIRLRTLSKSDVHIYEEVVEKDEYRLKDAQRHLGINNPKVFDFGGYIGTFSLKTFAVFKDAKVYVFEGNTKAVDCLRHNLKEKVELGTCIIDNVVIGESKTEKTLTFCFHRRNPGGSWFVNQENVDTLTIDRNEYEVTRKLYKVESLSSLCNQYGVPDILRIDIEGAESKIFAEQSKRYLKDISYICMEWHGTENLKSILGVIEKSHVVIFNSPYPHGESGMLYAYKSDRVSRKYDIKSYVAHNEDYTNFYTIEKVRKSFEKYEKQNLFRICGYEKMITRYPGVRGVHIDIGAGCGWLAKKTSAYFGKVIAIEPSVAAIIMAKEITRGCKNIDFVISDAITALGILAPDSPVFFTTSTVFAHLEVGYLNDLLGLLNNMPTGSIFVFDEPYGCELNEEGWCVRPEEWWTEKLPDWHLKFSGKRIPKRSYWKGLNGVKVI